jgi:hypothetical protein
LILQTTPAWESIITASIGQYADMGLNRTLIGINPSLTASFSFCLRLCSRCYSGYLDIIFANGFGR